jgi:hypothetical protein
MATTRAMKCLVCRVELKADHACEHAQRHVDPPTTVTCKLCTKRCPDGKQIPDRRYSLAERHDKLCPCRAPCLQCGAILLLRQSCGHAERVDCNLLKCTCGKTIPNNKYADTARHDPACRNIVADPELAPGANWKKPRVDGANLQDNLVQDISRDQSAQLMQAYEQRDLQRALSAASTTRASTGGSNTAPGEGELILTSDSMMSGIVPAFLAPMPYDGAHEAPPQGVPHIIYSQGVPHVLHEAPPGGVPHVLRPQMHGHECTRRSSTLACVGSRRISWPLPNQATSCMVQGC